MSFTIVTNNKKVFNFYKETDEVVLLENESIERVLLETYKCILKGHKLLSDPIISNIENSNNPFKSIIVSKNFTTENIASLNLIKGALNISKKLPNISIKELSKESLEEYKFIDLNLLINGIKELKNLNL
ncbi:GrdX family protein [Fusobacterium perfoetens]|uniref:GrdX family protein n=1 Tax=Fusobacterium perfoetens TaxID=852 RepID=UPI0004882FB4|nr:GrdX family protein [Fusobacterium perfoetens]MCI6153113.1 GrdX family protein [Fusobacterium perfoetens]MDY3236925.1 GrdX family protein [Fusobacterium perfoetens]